MLRSFIAALSIVFAVVAIPVLSVRAEVPHGDVFNAGEINWLTPKAGIYEATKSGKPVIMIFHATWCPSCKRYRAVFSDAGIVSAAKDFVMILVDVDQEKEINGAFAPDGSYVPRTLFLDPDGNVSNKLVGKDAQYPHTIDVDKPDELLALMKKAKETGFGRQPAKDAAEAPDNRT